MVNTCGYKLATKWQNFMEITLNLSENIAKSIGGGGWLLFDAHCIRSLILSQGRDWREGRI